MKFWILRGLAVIFFVAAFLQWVSSNLLDWDDSRSIITSTFGWFWTVVIAAPGCFLWVMATHKSNKAS